VAIKRRFRGQGRLYFYTRSINVQLTNVNKMVFSEETNFAVE